MKPSAFALLAILLLALTAYSAVAFPTGYNEPTLLADATTNASANGAVIGTYGAYTYAAVFLDSSGSDENTDLYVLDAAGNVLNTLNLGGLGSVRDGIIDDDRMILHLEYHNAANTYYSITQFYSLSNPVSPVIINSSTFALASATCAGTAQQDKMFYDSENDVAYVYFGDGCTQDGAKVYLDGNTATSEAIETIAANLNRVFDTATVEGVKLFIGTGDEGATDPVIIFTDTGTVMMNVTSLDYNYANSLDTPRIMLINEAYAIQSDGYLAAITGFAQYDTLSTRCGNGSFTVIDAYDLDYIVGIDSSTGTFKVCDASDLAAATLEDTNVTAGASLGKLVGHGIARVGASVTTNSVQPYLWDFHADEFAADDCLLSDGCYFYDTFSYSDTVLNHGWGGWSVAPNNYQLGCFLSSQYIYAPFAALIDPNTGDAVIEFDATICGDPTASLNVWLANGDDVAVGLWITGDNETGTIRDHNYADLGELGATTTDPGNLSCSGLNRFDKTFTIVVHPQNTPRTYDLYMDGAAVALGEKWTDIGQSMAGIGYIYFGGSYAGSKCFYYLDNVHVYTTGAGVLNETALAEAKLQLGPFNLNPGNASFDDSVCGAMENVGLCFFRELIGGLLGWFWKIIVYNPLEVLGLIFILGLVGVIAYRVKNR